jgi:hypothetical protein
MSWVISPSYKDPDFANVSLLLHGNGTNGSTTITDSSPTPKTVTAVGNAQISTAVADPFGNSSKGVIAVDGTGDYLDTGSNSAFGYGLNDFTIEFWIYRNASTALQGFLDQRTGIETVLAPTLYISSNSFFYFANGANRISGGTLAASQWVHIAVSRSGTATKLFANGVQVGSTFTDTLDYIDSPVRIGGANGGAGPGLASLNGYIDDLRITKGIARYTANFTPPTAQFPDI